MSKKEVLKELEKLKIGDKIVAVIRHCNPKLKLEDQTVNLTLTDDNFYIDDGPDELSWNWDIISFERVEKEEKKNG